MNVKKLLCLLLATTVISVFLCSCAPTFEPTKLQSSEIKSDSVKSFTKIGFVLANDYDTWSVLVDNTTKIVYLQTAARYDSVTPYLAPNGQPYKYDENTKTLVPLPAYLDEVIPEEWIIPVE